ncbi:hypothetical protein [Micromonospora sp. DT227]|uniref:hypothetical protein n=1 Tax=Micromonospora sp. DT227 TaxID=3393433 RepID=UPI003CEEFDE0
MAHPRQRAGRWLRRLADRVDPTRTYEVVAPGGVPLAQVISRSGRPPIVSSDDYTVRPARQKEAMTEQPHSGTDVDEAVNQQQVDLVRLGEASGDPEAFRIVYSALMSRYESSCRIGHMTQFADEVAALAVQGLRGAGRLTIPEHPRD